MRPHEALQMRTPAELYESSPRNFPERVPELHYPSSMGVRRVKHRGHFRWQQSDVFLTEVLWGEPVGLLPIDDRYFTIYFGPRAIARFDSHELRMLRIKVKSKNSYKEERNQDSSSTPAYGPTPQDQQAGQKVSGMRPV